MANKDLKDKFYNCPTSIINKLKTVIGNYESSSTISKRVKGYKRAKDIINNPQISQDQMERIKNYFDSYQGDGTDVEYKLNGGDIMKNWVNQTLENVRGTIHDIKKTEMNAGKENSFIKTHTKDKDNANPTKVNLPKPEKGSQHDNIYNNRVRYENFSSEIEKMKYLIEYMDNNKNKIL